jgi:hypothetical protein
MRKLSIVQFTGGPLGLVNCEGYSRPQSVATSENLATRSASAWNAHAMPRILADPADTLAAESGCSPVVAFFRRAVLSPVSKIRAFPGRYRGSSSYPEGV